jgi:hypothetical protein
MSGSHYPISDERYFDTDHAVLQVMRSQFYRLAEVAEHPRTTIQVIRSGGAHAGLLAYIGAEMW